MSNKRVLVTGSSSFTGHYLLSELVAHGYRVFETDLESFDLRDYDSVYDRIKTVKPNYVIHLAALSFVDHDNINELYEVNLQGTINLLRALEQVKVNLVKVVLASSANIYGNSDVEKISESQLISPTNHYAISKYAMEMAAKQWKEHLPIVITRPFNYTGIGQAEHFLIPKIVKHFQQKRPTIELGNIDVYRDFSDVRDVAKWYADILGSDKDNSEINLCSGKLTSLLDIINLLNDIAGYKIKVEINPEFVRSNEIKKLCGDDTLLKSVIAKNESILFKDTLHWMFEKEGN